MYFTNAILATGVCLLQFCTTSQAISFGEWPHELTPGKPATVKWSDNSDSLVTIALCKGKATDLKQVKTITAEADGNDKSFTWHPEDSLEDGDDYALSIEQDGSKNYSGHLKVSHDSNKSHIPPGKGPNPHRSSTSFGTAPQNTGVAKGNSDSDSPVVSGKTALHQHEEQTGAASVYGVPLRLALGTVAVLFVFTT